MVVRTFFFVNNACFGFFFFFLFLFACLLGVVEVVEAIEVVEVVKARLGIVCYAVCTKRTRMSAFSDKAAESKCCWDGPML